MQFLNKQRGAVPVLVIVGIAIIVLGGGAWWMTQQSSTNEMDKVTMGVEKKGLLDKALDFGSDVVDKATPGTGQVCTYTDKDELGNHKITVYTDGPDKMRMIYESDSADFAELGKQHMSRDGEWVYMWSDNISGDDKIHGYKHRFEDYGEGVVDDFNNFVSEDEADTKSCLPWIVDNSMFRPTPDKKIFDGSNAIDVMDSARESGDVCAACEVMDDVDMAEACLAMNSCYQ
jgi:hypothetical protein